MNILVIGCGRLGSRLAGILDSKGHDVAVLDNDPNHFFNLPKNFNGITVVGMPMDIKGLKSAGVEGCDAMAVVTPDDNLNITVSQIAREFFGIENVVARISDPLRENVFKSFGLKTVCPTNLASDAISVALTVPWEPKNVTFGTSTVSFHAIKIDREHNGISLSQVLKNKTETLFGVIRGGGKLEFGRNLDDSLTLSEGDKVIFSNIAD